MPALKNIILLVMLVLFLSGSSFYVLHHVDTRKNGATHERVIQIIQNLPQSFLVLLTQETLVVSHRNHSSWLLGTKRGQSSITVRLHWGFDLEQITPADIMVSQNRVVIRAPDPRLFDVVPDLPTWRYTGKRSGLQIISDSLLGTSLEYELLADVQDTMRRYRTPTQSVDRQGMIQRLNDQSDQLFAGTGLHVRFE
jgi:hypothetical protein